MSDAEPHRDDKQPVGINSETAAAAVALLQAQLEMATNTFDNLDRRASLLPPFLGVAAGLLLVGTPSVRFSPQQTLLLGAGLAVGVGAGFAAIQALVTRRVAMGPDSMEIARSIIHSLDDFNRATADALAKAVIDRLEVNRTKAKWLNAALRLTGLTMLLLALARIAGGL